MLIKRLLLSFITIAFAVVTNAQQNDYSTNWKKADAFEKKGLTKSALTEVETIFNLALKDKNDAQQIKASIYQIKYHSMTDEDSRLNNFFYVDTLISKTKAPAKNILLSMQAEMLWQYLQNNRWRFYNRTALAEEKSNDISTWSIDKINTTIAALYKASLLNEAVLKTTKLNGYDAILIKGTNTRQLRPTLYDFLAQRALSFFVTDEPYITKPAYAFTIDDTKYFAPATEFANTNFTTKDTAALYFKAIQLFQNIIKFHLNDALPSALIDADLIRMDFVNNHAVMVDKEKLYEAALKNIETTYPNDSTTAQAIYLRANIYYNRGQDYNPLSNTTNQYEIKRAKELCETIIQKYPQSEGGINAQNLINQIEQPSLNLETEKVNIPNQSFRSLVSYKNINTLYLRVIKTTRDEIKKLDRTDENKYWNEVLKLKAIKEWNINLPDLKDYQTHSAEIKTDGLDNGVYFILASKSADFSLSKNIIAKQQVYISNISYINNNGNDYYVLNRDNGMPLQNALIQIWENKYDYTTSKSTEIKAEQYTTNINGYFHLLSKKEGRTVLIQVITKNEELFFADEYNGDDMYLAYQKYEPPSKPTTFIFTDRSIYRPGQTIYFKGIVVNKDEKKNKSNIVPNFKTTVLLIDNNNETVISLPVTTNEFGSYHGTFVLPQGLLNGSFSIKDSITDDNESFSVEEYKRPKFFVEIQKPKGTYRLNDSITVTGSAKAYAGNNIDGATVKFRVVRKTNFPIWNYNYRGGNRFKPYGRNEEMEIKNGEITTNENGEFKITFKALPDKTIDKKQQPTFNYEVSADITDINGETRSGNTSVVVAYQMLQLNIVAPDKTDIDSLKNITVKSTNLNDIEENTIVSVDIQKLKSPDRIFRDRLWSEPDQFTMSKDEYYNYFPYDIYKDENEVANYAIENNVYEKSDSSNRLWAINNKLQSGYYKITASTKDKYGEPVTTTKYIQLTAPNEKLNAPADLVIDNSFIEPGEKTTYKISTGFNKIWLITGVHKMDNTNAIIYPTIQADKPLQQTIIATEADRGGINIDYAFVQHNRFYTSGETINILWSNKDLNIGFNTFRNKLLPGAKETWSIKISGNKNEKAAAEMLTAMYDASLDQFSPHSWQKPSLWNNLDFNDSWDSNGFTRIQSDEKNGLNFLYKQYLKSYDNLLSYESVRLVRHMRFAAGSMKTVSDNVQFNMNSMKGAMAAKLPPPARIETIKFTPPEIVNGEGDKLAVKLFDPSGNEMSFTTNEGAKDKTVFLNNPLEQKPSQLPIQIRKNFNETAFFYPDLKTDTAGNIEFSFTIPDAVTQWKWMLLAHTKDMATAYTEKTVTTQKPLMVQPNAPRFLREGDKMEFSAKIVNLSDSTISGNTELQLLDATTNQPIDNLFKNNIPTQSFTVPAGQSIAVKFPIDIPLNFNSALTYRIIAKSRDFSDGEEMAIPVLSNRTLVTESMPLNIRNTNKKEFKFDKLLNSGNSNTLSNHALTVEFTSNPVWYAVQALPYLMEYPYECAEQTFNRYYANTLASYISNSTPRIKEVFAKWADSSEASPTGGGLEGALQKNEELKSALLQETPWVLDAKNENQQKKNIALLFDMVRMSAEQDKALNKLKDMQSSNGGFVWFKGGPDDRYITQYIITGIGHLKKLNALNGAVAKNVQSIIDNAVPYLDKKIKEDYDNLIKYKSNLKENNLSSTQIQYLYMRSFFPEYKIATASQMAYTYYKNQAKKYWLSNSKYTQAMIALALYRTNDNATPKAIIKSLKENAINKEEMGMYWKEWTSGGYYWYQAPIESQALMIEAFTEIDKNPTTIDDLKTWLLKQKQTQNWKTTKATAEACYALLLSPTTLQRGDLQAAMSLNEEQTVQIQLGDTVISSNNQTDEAGTGYFKTTINTESVKPQMGNITVSTQSNNKGTLIPTADSSKVPPRGGFRGAVYWQYFEDLDKITPSETPLKLVKKLFIEKNTDKGPVLVAVTDTTTLHVGDKIKVRIELRVDRLMEYVHMKDMRAACMEPVNVLSEYKWQDGLGYYESTKDASTNFFFGSLPRGTYVFEYPMFVTHSGNFSNGITSIQCMYAPEFTAHSEGVRVTPHPLKGSYGTTLRF